MNQIQKMYMYDIIFRYIKASEEVENGIYDPIELCIEEIQRKYTINEKTH